MRKKMANPIGLGPSPKARVGPYVIPRTEFLEWLAWIHSKLIICTLNVALARTCVVPYGWNHPAKPVEEGFQTHPRFDVVRNVVRNQGRAFIYRIFIE